MGEIPVETLRHNDIDFVNKYKRDTGDLLREADQDEEIKLRSRIEARRRRELEIKRKKERMAQENLQKAKQDVDKASN